MNNRAMTFAALAFLTCILIQPLAAQIAPICDSGGVCGTDPNPSTNPSYAGLRAARPMKQNARGTQNPTVTASRAPGTVPIIIGSQSYNKAIPILSLPGRGLNLNLTLYYNSRIWAVDTVNATVSLNTDRDFPSYGFRLDFGFMEYDANDAQFILTESDGSKHAMPLTANTANGSIFDSNDGTFIEFNNQSLVLVYKNGKTVKYQAFPSQPTLFRPIQIKDRNGNYISIAYVAGTGNDQHIDSITDTLGRVIKFIYDGASHLSQITQTVSASTDPTGTHVWATFEWNSPPVFLTYGFSGLTVTSTPNSGTQIPVLTACRYSNQTGYKFSYGAWGIVNRIDQLSSTGSIRSYETYNYPDASQPISDAPRYTSMTISPDGTSTSTWNYSVTQSDVGQVTSETITDPLGTSRITSLNTDGTLKSTQIKDSAGKIFRTVTYSWKPGAVPLITSVSATDDAGNQNSISYTYDAFGNVTDLAENDFNNQTIRHTITTYMGTPYSTNHIFDLPQSIQVKDSGLVVRSRIDFNYDQTTPTPLGAVTQNDGTISTPRGNLTSVSRYPDSITPGTPIIRNITYDSTGNVIAAELDCCKKRFNFDPNSNYAYLSSVVRGPDGGTQFTSSFSFNFDNGLMLSSSDENNQKTSYVYDSMNRVKTVNTPPSNGSPVSQTIDYSDDGLAPGLTISGTANSTKIIQAFDGLGHLTRQDTKDSSTGNTISTTQFQYDQIWRRKATSNPYMGAEAVLWNNVSYDALNRVISTSPPSGGSTQFNFFGNTVTITDPAGKQRRNFLDGLGRLVRVDEPGWGDALTAIDSISISGAERSKTYIPPPVKCPRPPMPCDQTPSDPVTTYDTGTVSATINGIVYSYTYGQADTTATVAGNLANKINSDPARAVNASPSGATISLYAVNAGASGNSISVSTSSVTSNSTTFGSGTTSFPAGTFTPTLSGGENAVTQANAVLTATRHVTTTYAYDLLDDLTSVSLADMGTVAGVRYASQPRSYAYDGLGRLTIATTPESGTVTNYYTDINGAICSGDPSAICRIVDARQITKTFTYNDPLSRITGISYSDATPSVIYTYDAGGQTAFALGRLTTITEPQPSQTIPNAQIFVYDNLGRTTSVTQVLDGTNYAVQYGYNAANQLTSMTYPSGRVVKRDYDAVGRISQITDSGNLTNPYLKINSTDYDGAGEVKNLALGNGVKGVFSYNDHLQISSLRYFNPTAPAGTPDLLNLSYDYTTQAQPNNNGQIQIIHYYSVPNVEDTTKSESFTYDQWSRLSAAQTVKADSTAGTWSLTWGYDRLGNRKQQTLVGGNLPGGIGQPNFMIDEATNRINAFSYDNAGNLIGDTAFTYAYDGANRMKQAQQIASPNTITASTFFGPLRIKKVVGPTATQYIYSGSKPIAEYLNGSTTPSKEYVYVGARLLATLFGTSTTYHLPDHLSNRAETDANGTLIRSFGHFPYGEVWYETSADKGKFTSYERDSGSGETGLDYAVFRYYGSGQGRFISPDVLDGILKIPQSLNRYAYVLNNPINSIDPLGLCTGFIGRDSDGNPIFGEVKCTQKSGNDDGSDGSGGGGGDGGGTGGGGHGDPCGGQPCDGGSNGGGGGGEAEKKKKKEECDKAYAEWKSIHDENNAEGTKELKEMGAEMAAGAAIGCVTGAAETETAAVVIGGAAGTAVEPGGGTILGAAIGGAAGTPLAVGNCAVGAIGGGILAHFVWDLSHLSDIGHNVSGLAREAKAAAKAVQACR